MSFVLFDSERPGPKNSSKVEPRGSKGRGKGVLHPKVSAPKKTATEFNDEKKKSKAENIRNKDKDKFEGENCCCENLFGFSSMFP